MSDTFSPALGVTPQGRAGAASELIVGGYVGAATTHAFTSPAIGTFHLVSIDVVAAGATAGDTFVMEFPAAPSNFAFIGFTVPSGSTPVYGYQWRGLLVCAWSLNLLLNTSGSSSTIWSIVGCGYSVDTQQTNRFTFT